MNFRSALSYLFILVTLFVALAQAKVEEEKPSSKFESESIDAAKPVDPAAKIKYYIEFNEEVVKQEEMDAVVDWLKARSIKPEEVEMASYMAYIIAEMDKSLADELMNYAKEKELPITEIGPDNFDWSDADKEDL